MLYFYLWNYDWQHEVNIVLKPVLNAVSKSGDDVKAAKNNITGDVKKLLLTFDQEFKQK